MSLSQAVPFAVAWWWMGLALIPKDDASSRGLLMTCSGIFVLVGLVSLR